MTQKNSENTQKTEKVEFIVPHSEAMGLKWVCVVTAEILDPALADDNRFLSGLRRAVTRWINETDAGKAAWKESCEDFNIGDLGNQMPFDEKLVEFMSDERIVNLELNTFGGGSRHWVHDTHLVDELDLVEEVFEMEETLV
jgi:hypothetical protein